MMKLKFVPFFLVLFFAGTACTINGYDQCDPKQKDNKQADLPVQLIGAIAPLVNSHHTSHKSVMLKNLIVEGCTLSPAFDATLASFSLACTNPSTTVGITIIPENPDAALTLDGYNVQGGLTYGITVTKPQTVTIRVSNHGSSEFRDVTLQVQ